MKQNEVKTGGLYVAKVSDRLVTVRIDSTHTKGGWNATNTATGKRIHVQSAQRLRGPAGKKAAAAKDARDARKKDPSPTAGPKPAKTKKTAVEKMPERVGALAAAARVLADVAKPMRSQEMIAAMAEQGLWSSPAGKTPHATLYAAIIREIRDKKGQARFKKVDRGQFAFNGGTK